MSGPSWMDDNLCIRTLFQKETYPTGMVQMHMCNNDIVHLIKRKTKRCQSLFDMFNRGAWTCFNKCQSLLLNHIRPCPLGQTEIKTIYQFDTVVDTNR